ncbi:putative transcriptional regulator [Fonsecaea pedrosoi]|nr:putative transcriptional regulator [Fonsecaea pedrosoi]
MSVSDSELSEASETPTPPDNELEQSLRHEVDKALQDGIEFSNNSIRAASETQLGLPKGFYKQHEEWAQRSKAIIADQLDVRAVTESPPPEEAKPKAKEPEKTSKKRKTSQKQKESTPNKRRKAATAKSRDHASKNLSSPQGSVDSEAMQETPKTKPGKSPQKARSVKSKPVPTERAKVSGSGQDDEQAKKSSKRRDSAGQTPKKPASRPTTKPKADANIDIEQAEIKRLQGWLMKCGIRKLWGKELKPYETSKAKIKHLKQMLADIGMTGRYSAEKANQIKEARELAADIEAVQEGEARWGAFNAQNGAQVEKGTDGPRPTARRLVRGAKNYDFLSSDGEETD